MPNVHRNSNVVRLWAAGRQATNHKRTLYSMEDGSLWSYNLKIGQRTDAGVCVVADYMAPHFRSQTTSCHVSRAKGYADMVMNPKVWFHSPMSKVSYREQGWTCACDNVEHPDVDWCDRCSDTGTKGNL